MQNVEFSTLCIRDQLFGGAKKMVMGSIPTGDAVTVLHSRGTLSMREMSLQSSIIGLLQSQ